MAAPVRNVGLSRTRNTTSGNIRGVPQDILDNASLNEAVGLLPSNYNFEVYKTLWRIRTEGSKIVALQFPEGLLMYACLLADIFRSFGGGVSVLILGDVTYGACCVDDLTASKLGADLLVHYGHSCLIPVSMTRLKTMYVFVEIFFDSRHLIECVKRTFPRDTRIALLGTIQFVSIVHQAAGELKEYFGECVIPQEKPLSVGETLGCTSPIIFNADKLLFVSDGRFHLEAAMIRNPAMSSYRYDPYSKCLTSESYDVRNLHSSRLAAIEKAKLAKTFGVVLGTLGRQGNPPTFARLQEKLLSRGKRVVSFLMSEINPAKLVLIDSIDVWVQVACPRLSIDWAGGFAKPLLTPYELQVAIGEEEWKSVYPMNFYSR